MSKDIKHFINQVGTDTSGKWISVDKIEHLSELIVQECANVLLEWKKEPFPFDEELAANLIKEHFGIE